MRGTRSKKGEEWEGSRVKSEKKIIIEGRWNKRRKEKGKREYERKIEDDKRRRGEKKENRKRGGSRGNRRNAIRGEETVGEEKGE